MKENVNNSAAAATDTQAARGFYKLNWLQRIGFGSGDLAQNLIYQTICMYLLFFYTSTDSMPEQPPQCFWWCALSTYFGIRS